MRLIRSGLRLIAFLSMLGGLLVAALPAHAHDVFGTAQQDQGVPMTLGDPSPETPPFDDEAGYGQCHGSGGSCYAVAANTKAFGERDAGNRRRTGARHAVLWSGIQAPPPHKPPIVL